MKTLLLLRHAKSSQDDAGLDDHDRPLAPRGERARERIGRWLAASRYTPDVVLCSSAKRAVDTLAGVLPHLEPPPSVRIERSLYLATPEEMLRAVSRLDDRVSTVLVVGHNPGIQAFAADLAGDGDPDLLHRLSADKFPTAALAAVGFDCAHWPEVDFDVGRLLEVVTPRSLGN